MTDIIKEISLITGNKNDMIEDLISEGKEGVLAQSHITVCEIGERFVMVDESIENVWILLSGKVKALEEFYTGDIFTFNKFTAPEIFGEMEILADINKYRATLITEKKSFFLNIPAEVYLGFLKRNPDFLFKRTELIMKRYFEDQKRMRIFLMIKSKDRIKIYLTQHYELYAHQGVCNLRIPRQQIAEETGYSVKTVNRIIRELQTQNLITVAGQKLIIKESQYKKMLNNVENFINY